MPLVTENFATHPLMALLQESLAAATRLGAAKPSDFRAVIVDTTVQEKAITFPTDAKLMHRARERLQSLPTKGFKRMQTSYVAGDAGPRKFYVALGFKEAGESHPNGERVIDLPFQARLGVKR